MERESFIPNMRKNCFAPTVGQIMLCLLLVSSFTLFRAQAQTTINMATGTISPTTPGCSFSGNVLNITANGTYIITGTTTTRSVVVAAGLNNVNITLDNCSITVPTPTSPPGASPPEICAFAINSTATQPTTVKMTLVGVNVLTSGSTKAGLNVTQYASLTITGTGGKLTATGGPGTVQYGAGAGIGSNGNRNTGQVVINLSGAITINSGTVIAYGGQGIGANAGGGAGIGGGGGNGGLGGTTYGEIKICGDDVRAIGGSPGSGSGGGAGAGIGGGGAGHQAGNGGDNGGKITICGGKVYAEGGNGGANCGGAGIGGGGSLGTGSGKGGNGGDIDIDFVAAQVTVAGGGSTKGCVAPGIGSGGQACTTTATTVEIITQPPAVIEVSNSSEIGNILTVVARINPAGIPKYQWYKNTANSTTGGIAIPAPVGTSSTLQITETLTDGQKYFYYCVVSDECGKVAVPSTIITAVKVGIVPEYSVTVSSTGTGATGGGNNFAAGEKVLISAGTPPAGTRFTGWTTSDGVSFDNAANASTFFTMPAKNVTVKANFINVWTVTFKNWNGTVLKTQTVDEGSGATPPANPTRTGYTFAGWDVAYNNVTGNLTVTAVFNINIYTVTFVDWNGAVLKTETVNYGSAATAPANPSRAGYTFSGWNKAFNNITGNLTVTALYTVNSSAVTVLSTCADASGSGTYSAGAKVTIFAGTPVEGEFIGWTTSDPGVIFDNPDSPTTFFYMPDHSVTVKANFNPKYTVTVIGGTGATGSGEYAKNETVVIDAGIPPSGQRFKNWTTTSLGVTLINANNPVTTFIMPGNHVTITANFVSIYTVTFKDWDDTLLKTELNVEHGTAATAPAEPSRTGYTFTGWDIAFNNVTANLTVTALYAINIYTVSFVDWDNAVLKTQTVNYGSAATAPANPTRDNYIFTGWLPASFNNITGDLTVTAQYNIVTYAVQFVDWNGALIGLPQIVNHEDDAVAPADPSRTGYTFTGWDLEYTNIHGNLTVTAQYVINTYTVTFADWDGTVLKTETVNYGLPATPPLNVTRDGYTLTGWSPNYDFITGDVTVTAQYAMKTYTVTFVDWDGRELKKQLNVTHGTAATAPMAPTRTGYTFVNWDVAFNHVTDNMTVTAVYAINIYTVTFKNLDGTVLKIETVNWGLAATAPANPTYEGHIFTGWDKTFNNITGDLTVTALYNIIQYRVTFVDWDNTVLKPVQNVNHGSAAIPPPNPSRIGYTFSGWDKVISNVTGDMTVTALYNVNQYTVTFVDWNGTVLKTQTVNYGSSATAPANPTRPNYNFTGWDVLFNNITGNLTVTAQYAIKTYTVTFIDWNGELLKTETVDHGTPATAPPNPTRTGYTFFKWDKVISNITGDLTVTALYNIIQYRVTFVDWDGTELKPVQNVNHGSAAIPPTNPSRTGYTFTGWDKVISNVTGDMTVTALYNVNVYTVTFVDWNGTVLKTEPVNYGSSATAPANPARTNYNFTGWNVLFNNVTGNLTVTAQYAIISYTVTFIDHDGAVLKTQNNVDHGTAATAPPNPTRTGYTFTGWDKVFYSVTGDLTVTALYEINTYNVTVLSVGTGATGTGNYVAGNPVPINAGADPAGLRFTEWTVEAGGITLGNNLNRTTSFTMGGVNVIVKANFINVYSVIFVDWNGYPWISGTVDHGGSAEEFAPDPDTRAGYTFKGWDVDFSVVTSNLIVTPLYEIKTYAVTFYDDDGIIVLKPTQTVSHGASAIPPANPTRNGWTFTGWNPAVFNNITGALTVTAQYIINTYTVKFVDWDGTELKSETVNYNTGATAPSVPTREGYTFADWNTTFDHVTGDLTVTALYSLNSYTVTFKDHDGTVLKSETVYHGSSAIPPANPTRTGYTFTGWDVAYNNITGITDVTAQYDINKYTVKFVDWNGAVLDTQNNINHGSAATAPANPTRTGYNFTSWDVSFNNVTGNLTVTALYAIKTFNVTFVDWDNTELKATQIVNYGASAIPPANPTRTGYTFTGWDIAFNNVTGDLTVKAQYIINTYTVTFKDWNGTVLKTESVDYGTPATAPATPSREGYTFNGWSPANFTNVIGNMSITATYTQLKYTVTFVDWNNAVLKTENDVIHGAAATAPPNPTRTGYTFTGWDKTFYQITDHTTVKALYDINTYTVTFKDWNGAVLKTGTVDYGTPATAPPNPTRTGYTFTGWDQADFTHVTGNMTITALYDINRYTVTFVDWDNTVLKAETVNHGSAATAPPNPTRPNYYFTGWDKVYNNITGNMTVTALYEINKYSVTFKDWNGVILKTHNNIDHGSPASAPPNPTRTGYTFTGWDLLFNNVTGNMTVTALYDINVYTVTFKDWDGTVLKVEPVKYGYPATAPNPIRPGYTLTGWSAFFNNITDNLTVTALYDIIIYTVIFEDWDGAELKSEPVVYGFGATAPPNPTRAGYTFTGWNVPFDNITGDLTVTAQYAINTYTVTWNVNGGSPAPGQTSVSHGSSIAAPPAMTKTGCSFGGWYRDAGFSIPVVFPLSNVTGNVEFWAKWDVVVYAVIWNADGGTPAPTQTSVNYGDAITAPASISKTGYTFGGWYTDAAFGAPAVFPMNNVTGNQEFWAKWTLNTYTVIWHADGGTPVPTQTTVNHGGSIAIPASMTRTGYTFGGWYANAAFSGAASSFPIVATGNQEFWAKWNINTYAVTFVDWNGAVLKTETVNHGSPATAPANPSRTGYTFTGWSPAVFTNITAPLTITAQYTIESYTVTFKDWDDTVLKEETVEYGSSANPPAPPTREGYTFTGWSEVLDNVTGELTVTAQYEKTKYTVTVLSAGAGKSGDGNYEEGETVNIFAGLPDPEQDFINWTVTVGNVTLNNADIESTFFTMPAEPVTVKANYTPKRAVVVVSIGTNPSGAGDYAKGEIVEIGAGTAPAGKRFKYWNTASPGVVFANANNANTTFIMPANVVTVTAVFVDVYTVTVVSAGTGANGVREFEAGEIVSIYAGTPPAGKRFDNWTTADGVVFANANNATTTFIMPAKAVTVRANFVNVYTVTVVSEALDASGAGNYDAGETVSIYAGTAPAGKRFKNWTTTSAGITFVNASNATTTFTMPASPVTVTANFEDIYAVTVNSAGTGATGNGVYAAGETVSIYAGTAPAGKRFKNWTTSSTGITFANANSATTTFTMPANAVTVTANFVDVFTVTVVSAGTGASGSGTYEAGEIVSIFAGTPPSGKRFNNWTTTSPGVSLANANNAATTFVMPANAVTVTANFIDDFTVTVVSAGTGALGNGKYAAGETVSIFAGTPPANQRFKNWIIAGDVITPALANAAREITTFTMPANNVTVTAVFEPTNRVTVVSVATDATGTGNYSAGENVDIFAGTPPMGQVFVCWTTLSPGVIFADASSPTTSFTMPAGTEPVTVTANFASVYKLTVVSIGVGKNGDGYYEAGETASIFAGAPPAGFRFKNWTTSPGVTLANPNNAITTFPMPTSAVTATANFVRIYNVTVESVYLDARGSGDYEAGETVSIFAGTPPAGKQFKNWTSTSPGVTFANAGNPTTTFTMPSNAVKVTANFVDIFTVTVSSTGTGKSGDGNYVAGETVKIVAGTPPANQRFKNWTTTSPGVTFVNANNATTTFTMPANTVTVSANFVPVYTVVVNGGTGARGSGDYEANETVGIFAGTPPAGKQFKDWTIVVGGVTLTNANNTSTSFIMPANFVELRANFVDVNKVSVVSAGTGASGSGVYETGEIVSIFAGTPPVGKIFKNWTTGNGAVFNDADSPTTFFAMPANSVTVTAIFEPITYTVTWNVDGGTPAPAQTAVNHGDAIMNPAPMTKPDDTFVGWYSDAALTAAVTFPINNVTGDQEFWAKWTLTVNLGISDIIVNGLAPVRRDLKTFCIDAKCDTTATITITADAKVRVFIDGVQANSHTVDLRKYGDNEFIIKIKAQNDEEEIYTLLVNRYYDQVLYEYCDVPTVNCNPRTNGGNTETNEGYVFTAFQWYRDDVPIIGANKPYYQTKEYGIYYCEITVSDGSTWRTCDREPLCLGDSPLKAFPNPTQGLVTIDNGQLTRQLIQVFDMYGKLVMQPKDNTFDMSALPEGMYAIKVKGETVKVVLKK